MSHHTPGPWKYEYEDWCGNDSPHDVYVSGNQFESDDGVLCWTSVCIVCGNANSKEITAANARLIAAAPEMHDLLTDILNCQSCFPELSPYRKRISGLLDLVRGNGP